MRRSRSATILTSPTSPSSSAAASAAWCRPPATSRAPMACARPCRCIKALEACPHATVIPPDMAKYVRVGREVRQAMQALTPLVEPLSIDEAFLDLSGTERVHGMIPAKVLARFARDVERDIGISVSVGLSCNKFLAKIASDLDKPRGFAALDQEEARSMLAEKPVGFIFGVGPGDAGAPGAARLPHHRRPAKGRRDRDDAAVSERRPQAVAARPRHRRPPRRGRSGRQDDFERNHVRDRHPRFRDAGEDPVAAVREDVVAAQEQRACRLDRHAETEDRRFPPAHALAIDRRRRRSLPQRSSRSAARCWRRRSTAPPSA